MKKNRTMHRDYAHSFFCRLAMALFVVLLGLMVSPAFAEDESIVAVNDGTEGGAATEMLLQNGMAQPVFKYSSTSDKDYTNAGSELYRFAVYVETDYDTDRDGKYDLVKAYVQVPRAAVEGGYKAPVVFSADPYSAGSNLRGSSFKYQMPAVDDATLKDTTGLVRRMPGSVTTSSAVAAATTFDDPTAWTNEYDYFLVRGFAVVQAAGLGTFGSEGIECCSTEMERDAFVAIVEWLAGAEGRHAYANATDNVEVKADWSSGNVGMIGLSYPAEMAYATATSSVEGLKTIVPMAGPISMYDEHNSQGICTDGANSYNHMTIQGDACASRLFPENNPDANFVSLYERYRTYVRDGQTLLQGDYGPFWEDRDWYAKGMQSRMKASALIVMGSNDSSVSTKQFDLMRRSFIASGCEVKTIWHQGVHETLFREEEKSDVMIGDHTFLEWLNLWFTRALCGVENESALLPDFTVQSNVDGEFYGTDRWDEETTVTLSPIGSKETVVSAKGASMDNGDLFEKTFVGKASENAALWSMPVTEQFTIAGAIPVHVRAKVDDAHEGDDIMMHAILIDTADQPFYAYDTSNIMRESVGTHADQPQNYTISKIVGGQMTRKVVTRGAIDLRNPEAGYEPSTAVKRQNPIESNTYYDYTIYLRPVYYTVQPGHRIELYIVPFYSYSTFANQEARDFILEKAGLDSSSLMNIRKDYAFTIDNAASYAAIPVTEELSHLQVSYSAHVQGRGDLPVVADGATSGTVGEARRLEAISARVDGGSISYRSHVQGIGWMPWVADGAVSGTTGEARRLEAIQMKLSDELTADGYHVWYRVHSQTYGWLGWAHDGEAAGTSGQGRRAEAYEVEVLRDGEVPDEYVEGQASYIGYAVGDAHVQLVGWIHAGSTGVFGTTGEARRLEALSLTLENQPETGGIRYQAHVQGDGWQDAVADGDVAGTTGQSRRLEAVRLSLTGDMANDYSVWYRVHIQSTGWLGWAHDGADAGTVGLARRAEAVELQILPKGQVPRDYAEGQVACLTS